MKDKEAIAKVEEFLMFASEYFTENPNHINAPVLVNMGLVESMERVLELAKEYTE